MSACLAQVVELRDPLEALRAMAHRTIDQWIESLRPLLEQPKPPTLLEMSQHFSATRGELLGGILQSLSEVLYADLLHQRHSACPVCGKRLPRKRMDRKRYNTLQGPGALERPYFYCSDCKHGFHPFDEAIEMTRAFHQYDVEQKVLKLATQMPYADAAEIVSDLTGVAVKNFYGHHTLTQVTECADLETVLPTRAEIAQRIEDAKKTPEDRPVLVVALDGAHAPTRSRAKRNAKRGPGRWREVKGVRLYLALENDRIVPIVSWHQIQDAETMQRDLQQIAERIPKDQVRIALLGDGAAWVWNTLTACFPDGKQVLDYYHCSEHIHAVAEARYGNRPEALTWVEATLARLSINQVAAVIWGLQRMQADTNTRVLIDKLIGYLRHHQTRFDYAACKAEGIPIGSGGIESANKFISHARLKRSGAWWIVENGNGMLRLRCALYNDTFDRVFQKYRLAKFNRLGTNS